MSNKAAAALVEAIKQQQETERKSTPLSSQPQEFVFAKAMGVSPTALGKSRAAEQDQKNIDPEGSAGKQAESKQSESTQQASNLLVSKQLSVKKMLGMRADVTATFRFPQELLKRLDKAYYRIPERFDTRVTRNSIVVAALAYLLADFDSQEEASLLYRLVVKHEEI